MKFRIAMILMFLSASLVFGDDMTFGYFCKCILFLAFVTPFGWGTMFIIGYLIVSGLHNQSKKIAATDYSPMKEEEKEVLTKKALREAFITAKKL